MVIDDVGVPANSDEWLSVTYPYTGQEWARVPRGNATDVNRAVQSARRCFESDAWQSLTASERGDLLYEFTDRIEQRSDELIREGILGNGKLVREMRGRIDSMPRWFRYFGGLADKIEGETVPVDIEGTFTHTRKEPYGVVGAITPWNSPLSLGAYKIAPALAAGNTVVIKPSAVNPVTTIRYGELALEAGFPPGALNVVTGKGAEAGQALSTHGDVDKIAFTGGLDVGQQIGKAAGENILPVTLELGGKSPNIVFSDADFDAAIRGVIRGIFGSSGQTCIAGSRLLVHESIHDEFVNRLVDRVKDIKLGDPMDESSDMAPLASQQQLEKVQQYVEIAKEEGAQLVTGGKQPKNLTGELFFEPTIFVDVDNHMSIAEEEVFGPVLSVIPFSDRTDAIQKANDTKHGLAAGIWTQNIHQALTMVKQIEAGIVWVNTYRQTSVTTPFGGYKKSGVGRENGMQAIEEYLQTKSVYMNVDGNVPDPSKPFDSGD
jgi:aldehyde dehydrogenase (NAD+)